MIVKILETLVSGTLVVAIWVYRRDAEKMKWIIKWPVTLWLIYQTVVLLFR